MLKRWADRTPAVRVLTERKIPWSNELQMMWRHLRGYSWIIFRPPLTLPFENAIPQIQSLSQAPNQSLIYHRRASGLLIAAGGKDIKDVNMLPLEPSREVCTGFGNRQIYQWVGKYVSQAQDVEVHCRPKSISQRCIHGWLRQR